MIPHQPTIANEGLFNITTYLQSGNIIFTANDTEADKLAQAKLKVTAYHKELENNL